MRLLSISTMANELLSTRTMQMRVQTTSTMAEDGDNHKNNPNKVAKHKNDVK